MDANGTIREIERGWSRNPASLIGKSVFNLIPDNGTIVAFKNVLHNALKRGIPTSRFTMPMLIDGKYQIRHATIRRDLKNPGLILVSFYAIEV